MIHYTFLSKFLQYLNENCQIFARNLKILRSDSQNVPNKRRDFYACIPATAAQALCKVLLS